MIRKILIFGLIALLLLIPAASATINITVASTGSTFIQWDWNTGLTMTNVTVDGYNVCNFDQHGHTFILSGLNPNETHSISVYTATDFGTNTAMTTGETTAGAAVAQFFKDWLIVLLSIGLLFCGFVMHRVFFWGGSFVALYGVYQYVTTYTTITTTIPHIRFFICAALFLLGLFFWMAKKGKG
jgi:hypothetical protein